METLVTNVKKCYRDRAINYDDEDWPTNHSGKLMRLELVAKKKGEYFFASRQQKVNISEKNFKQGLITYDGLFKSGKKQVRKVLVEGSAGTGKTSLCISISKDWANDELFQEYELLLLLSLHQRKVAMARSLSKLIEHFTLHDIPSVVSHLEERKGEGILMIADGWDKLSESERQNGSFLHNLLFGDTLSRALVLVTSRPSSSAPLHRDTCIDRFIEVHGFNKRTLEDYVQSEVQKGDSSHLILEQLGCNPIMESMCKVPFICTVICHSLWHTFERALPPTMTELSTKVILTTMCNYVWKRGMSNNILTLPEVETLPENLLDSWWRLCQLAFEVLAAHKYQVDLSRIESGIESAGLLELITEGNNVIFHFLHPIFQEYLAALRIIKLSHTSPEKLLKMLDTIKSQHFTIFWQYFFGICMKYDQKNILKHAIHLLSTSNLYKSILCQCAFEARDADITSEIIKALMLCSEKSSIHFGDPITAHACTAILYVIDSMQGLACGMEINFKGCGLDSKAIGKLADILAKQPDQLQIKGLDLSDNGLSDDSIASLFHIALRSFQLLEKLFLRNNKIGDKSITAIVMSLTKSSSRSIIQLDLSYNSLTLAGLQTLQNAIKSNIFANIEILFMQGSLTIDASVNIQYFTTFADALLSHCRHLRRLDLSGNDFGESMTPVLSRVISKLIGFNQNFDLCMNKEYMSEVDRKFVAIMQDCIRRKGTIDHTFAHGVIVGPGRSGKNSLMNRLMSEGPPDPDIISPSTGVLEGVVKVEVKRMCTVAAAVNNSLWKRLDYDEEALELMMTTARSHTAPIESLESTPDIDNTKEAKVVRSAIVVVRKTSTSARPALPPRPEIIKIAKGSVVPMESDSEKSRHESVSHSSNVLTQERPLDIFKRAVKLRRMDALREHLESSWSLYLTNTGGQMEFQELLPLIVCGPSVFFITFPLDKDLHEHYTVRYQYTDGSEETYPSPSTLMDEILQTLATIAALDCTGPQHDTNLKPKVFFVGTHKDKIPESSVDDTIQKIDKQLQKEVRQTSLFCQGSVEFAVGTEQLMFAVNNLDKSDGDFQKIRSALEQSVERSKEFTIQCPSTWLIFSLVLRAKHKSSQVLSYNDCFTVAQSCGITDRTELNNALFFIHSRLGLVRFFCVEELNNLVVIDPQILFDKITKLIVETFISDHANISEIEDFQKRGIFSTNIMERINKKSQTESDTQLLFSWLLRLLDHLRIAAFFIDHKGNRKCFFPSVLCHAPEQLRQSIECNGCPIKPPPPLLIAFKSGFCPRGIPGAVIKYLMTNEMESSISWELYSSRVFRNQVSFSVGPCDIMLTIQPTHLKVSFDPESDAVDESEVKETCEETFLQLKQAMEDVTKGYRECDYFFTFYCTRPECKGRPHPAEIDWGAKKLKCKIIDRRSRLPNDYQLWIPQETSHTLKGGQSHSQMLDLVLDTEGVPKHLGQIVDSMCEWEGRIADELGLKNADVAAIKYEYPNKLKLQIRAALEKWKQKLGSNATYRNLITVFEQAGYQEYADTVSKLILQSSVDKTEKSAIFPTPSAHASLPQLPQHPQLPIFPEPMLSSSIALPSDTAVLIESEYQELQGQAIEESVYLKTEHVLEPVDEPSLLEHLDESLEPQLTTDEDDATDMAQHGITDPLSTKPIESDNYGDVSNQQLHSDVSDEIKICSPQGNSLQGGKDSQTDTSTNQRDGSDDIMAEINRYPLADNSMQLDESGPDSETVDGILDTKFHEDFKPLQDKSDVSDKTNASWQIHSHSSESVTDSVNTELSRQKIDHKLMLNESLISQQNVPASGGEGEIYVTIFEDIANSEDSEAHSATTMENVKTMNTTPMDMSNSILDNEVEVPPSEMDLEEEAPPHPRPDVEDNHDELDYSSSLVESMPSKPVQQSTSELCDNKTSISDDRISIALVTYEALSQDELTIQKGEELRIIESEGDRWRVCSLKTKKEGYVHHTHLLPITNIIPEDIINQEWFFGKITRARAEIMLFRTGYPRGTFLIRESETQQGQYSLSVKDSSNLVKHYHIQKADTSGYYFVPRRKFRTLEKLVKHYSENTDGLCCRLTAICPQFKIQAAFDPSTKFIDQWEIERKSLQFKRKLGEGKHGQVWEGVWNGTTPVAIKIADHYTISNEITLAEANILKKLHHQNIIPLYGVCSIGEPAYIITELMTNGNLHLYLKRDEGHLLKLPHLIAIASQIASGMSYLEELNFIHRDLCARNILIGEGNVKISNFGMAKIKEYRLPKGETCTVLLRWTAPEIFLLLHHTIKSDVWSFGIVLVELITHGQIPYPGLNNADVKARLTEGQGYRMPPPLGCPGSLYQIMMDCWKEDPQERPSFKYLKDHLENYYTTPSN